jgi:hypothetical protein
LTRQQSRSKFNLIAGLLPEPNLQPSLALEMPPILAVALISQHRVDPLWSYHRAVAVLPMQGAGTPTDPIRPKHAPELLTTYTYDRFNRHYSTRR